jgi:tetratricopeptide (TPR) repeat protein
MREQQQPTDGLRGASSTKLKPIMITNLDKFEALQNRNRHGITAGNLKTFHHIKSNMKRTSTMTNTTSAGTTQTTASKTSTSIAMTQLEEVEEAQQRKKCYNDLCWEPLFCFVFKRRRRRKDFLMESENHTLFSRRHDGFLALVVDDGDDDDDEEDGDDEISIENNDSSEDTRPLSPVSYNTLRTVRSEDASCDSDAPQELIVTSAATSGDDVNVAKSICHHCPNSKLSHWEEYCYTNNDVSSPLSSSDCSHTCPKVPSSPPSFHTSVNTNNNRERAYTAPPSYSNNLQLELETTLKNGLYVYEEERAVSTNNFSPLLSPAQKILEEAQILFQTALDCEQGGNSNEEAATFLLETLSVLRTNTSTFELFVDSERQLPINILQIKALHRLGVIQWKRGFYSDSLKCLTTCLTAQEEVSKYADNDYYSTFLRADTHRAIGSTHLSLGHYEEAQMWLRSSIKLFKGMRIMDSHLPYHQQQFHSGAVAAYSVKTETIALMLALSALGSVYQEQGQYRRAFKYFQRALHYYQLHHHLMARNGASDYSFHVANTWNKIGSVYEASGQHREAMASFSEALWLYRVSFGNDHVDTAVTYVNIGRIHLIAWKEPQEALDAFHEALRIFTTTLGERHRNTASVYYNLAMTHVFLTDFGQALEYFELCLHIQRDVLGDCHLDVASTFYSMAQMYEQLQKFDQALKLYKLALEIQTSSLGKTHLFAAITLHQIVAIKCHDSTISSASIVKHCTQILQAYHQWGIPEIHSRVKHVLTLIQEQRQNKPYLRMHNV